MNTDPNRSSALTGTLQQLLFSPKGALEGLLLIQGGKTLQVTIQPDDLDAPTLQRALSQQLELKAIADRSPKAKRGAHPVYLLKSLTKVGNKAPQSSHHQNDKSTVEGIVAAIHYARHGEPNGVVLESGEFVHLRPDGMKQCGLGLGARVCVEGKRRTTVLGTGLIEARTVNQHIIE